MQFKFVELMHFVSKQSIIRLRALGCGGVEKIKTDFRISNCNTNTGKEINFAQIFKIVNQI